MAEDKPGVYAETDFGHPEYFPTKLRYRILPEPLLSQELEKAAYVEFHANGAVDSITFQPNNPKASQDRRYTSEWDMPNGTWIFSAVFDGHGGEELAEHATQVLPEMIRSSLVSLMEASRQPPIDEISAALRNSLTRFDNVVRDTFLELFPGGVEQIERMSVDEIQEIINDTDRGGSNNMKTILCLRGTTAVLALLDPPRENLWIANLGDSQATLVSESPDGSLSGILVTQNHNGFNEIEEKRLREEHPDEPEVILNKRVLGAIMVTRALGDFAYKLAPIYTTKVFLNCTPGFRVHFKVEDWIVRSQTPPYVSNVAEIHHKVLSPSDKYLILSSDGLSDLYWGRDPAEMTNDWARALIGAGEKSSKGLSILRRALDTAGVQDGNGPSMYLTVETDHAWMDDTTVSVLTL